MRGLFAAAGRPWSGESCPDSCLRVGCFSWGLSGIYVCATWEWCAVASVGSEEVSVGGDHQSG